MDLSIKDLRRLLDWVGYVKDHLADVVTDYELEERIRAELAQRYEEARRDG